MDLFFVCFSMDIISRSDVDIAELEVSKFLVLNAPAPKQYRKKGGQEKSDNNNNMQTTFQSRARPRKSFEVIL